MNNDKIPKNSRPATSRPAPEWNAVIYYWAAARWWPHRWR